MSHKNCLIRQPAGLGDIIFCQKIADFLLAHGYQIWWPVIDQYFFSINRHMPKRGINFCRQSDEFPMKELFFSNIANPVQEGETANIYLPLQHADLGYPGESVLKAKYKTMAIDYSNWQSHFKFVRNSSQEDVLFYDVLGLVDDRKYSFVNLWYGSPPESLKAESSINTEHQIIEMSMIDGFTIFDWCKVLEEASEIYCVDTGLFYIIDMLQLKATKLEAYSKFNPSNYMHIDGLFQKPWNYNT